MDFKQRITSAILTAIQSAFGETDLTADTILQGLEIPPEPKLGDYAFPCFKLAKSLRKAPPMIADALKGALQADFLDHVDSVKGYLNFYIDRALYAGTIVKEVLESNGRYGSGDEGSGKTICIDYSSINIAKRFHIGHLSSTMIGHALAQLYRFRGYRVVSINHLGDWGTQFGKIVCAYKMWSDRETVERDGIEEMTRLYVRFEQESHEDKALAEEGRRWFKRIEDGDPEALEIFNWFKDVTLRDAARVYDLLGVHFDSYAGESFYNDKMAPVVEELERKGLLTESEGAKIVDLEPYGMPPCLILKKDGATLYATRDLAAAFYRKKTYDFAKCLYVVAYQQDLHFRQLFKVIDLMGYDWYRDMEHVSFGMVSFGGEALSTRGGHVVYLEDVLKNAIVKARDIIEEKSPGLENKDEVARQVGVGAVVFFDLYNNRIKDISFEWDRALNFDGETAPYVQYTHARCCSVLRKAGPGAGEQADYAALTDPEAQDVVRVLERFPGTVSEAIARSEPSLVTRYSVDLAQAFNKFYYEHRIMGDDKNAQAARLNLTDAVRQVIRTALSLIGIQAPERM